LQEVLLILTLIGMQYYSLMLN